MIGGLASVLSVTALATEGWWQSQSAKHGLWTASTDGSSKSIFIGQYEGYKVEIKRYQKAKFK